jgi:hypothetical protein
MREKGIFLLGILIFKRRTARRLYMLFGVKGLITPYITSLQLHTRQHISTVSSAPHTTAYLHCLLSSTHDSLSPLSPQLHTRQPISTVSSAPHTRVCLHCLLSSTHDSLSPLSPQLHTRQPVSTVSSALHTTACLHCLLLQPLQITSTIISVWQSISPRPTVNQFLLVACTTVIL